MAHDAPPWARWRPGPAEKLGYGGVAHWANKEFVVAHSVEGSLAGALAELDKPARQASWHATITYDGDVYWHYDATAVCWASGAVHPNQRGVAIEHEGRAGQPLTRAQVHALARIIGWCARRFGWRDVRRGVELIEHRECVRWGAQPTSCPSDRIPWRDVIPLAILYAIGGDPLDVEQVVRALLQSKQARDMLVAAMLDDAPVHLALDPKKAQSLRSALGQPQAQDVQRLLSEVAQRAELGPDLAEGLRSIWRRLQAVSRALDPRQPVP